MDGWERDAEHDLTCFACGCKNIESRKVFDHFCAGRVTWECRCMTCRAEWFDDTIGVDR